MNSLLFSIFFLGVDQIEDSYRKQVVIGEYWFAVIFNSFASCSMTYYSLLLYKLGDDVIRMNVYE